ncbi:hypothetical protein LEP1GSC173_2144 [Leptospira interrogans str. HAI1594]|uniref:Uncharacterized protein n=5 Tax=Leptospira interrogans TaxID=173 RepID=M6RCQ3_LEPIR|nr:hypothetical protein LEP1GSC080_0388 [Leptospira interrogans str. FPW2026]EKP20630.1 hypothetical protein LEP1GSC117_2483 [Leptospira interrogans serovar Icterohaemorrhagiae str. Verdun LP]EKP74556.1 hypothetical protein LEP1GSC173_2144 [Leptospira interrogans str. HAI1594]EMG19421.1 hypothetical protein LEP1GSC150_0609 [Leptospira interrogans serovar Copenhageni str. LT2050]EMJ54777.1 hypothetical protein LEP1GSC013_2522 [Leptospira interrogans serovar Valbuzzi str. Duyster]EMM92372.1 hypo
MLNDIYCYKRIKIEAKINEQFCKDVEILENWSSRNSRFFRILSF